MKIIKTLTIFFVSLGCLLTVKASPLMDEVSKQYVQLVLATGEKDPNFVDAYYGPQEWREQAHKNQIDLDKIVLAAKLVKNTLAMSKVSDEEIPRQKYLLKQLTAVISRVEMLQGNRFSFDEQSQALYDTVAPHYEMGEFDKVLSQLDKLLPGSGSLLERSLAYKKQFEIPTEKLDAVFALAIKACRERTAKYIQLLDNENFKLEYVTDKPWSGYNWYQGNAQSLIQINTEFPVPISRAIDLGCHEGYPGHHTYNALLEDNLVNKKGWVELSVYPLFSPQSLIAEGSANYGIELAFPDDEKLKFEKDVLYPAAGIDPKLADDYENVQQLTAKLSYAGNEIARLYLNEKIDEIRAITLIQKYSLVDQAKAKQRLRFWKTYGSYIINYNWGKDMVKNWVEKGTHSQPEKWKRFEQLLSSPRLPSDLIE